MKMLSLFSGIGGIDLAARWAGIETVAFCERDKWCRSKLSKQFKSVDYYDFYDDIKEMKGHEIVSRHGRIDIVAGGPPCQPYSQAGKRRGTADDRHLWPEMLRIIKELRWPTWVIIENVTGIVGMVLDDVLDDLEKENYETQSFIIPACSVGAWHRRYRVFVVAHSSIERKRKLSVQQGRSLKTNPDINGCGKNVSDANEFNDNDTGHGTSQISQFETSEIFDAVSNTNEQRSQGYGELRERAGEWLAWKGRRPFQNIWESEPDVGRLAHGVPTRVAKLKALGNAVVPQQIYPIFKAIMEVSK